jgi:hypothetical protein
LLKINQLNKGQHETKIIKKNLQELSYSEKIEKFEKLGRITKEDDGKIITEENDEKIIVTWSSYM